MMTVSEAAKHMGVSAELIRRWCREKKIPGAIQTGIKRPEWIIPEKGVEEAMQNIPVKQRVREPLEASNYEIRIIDKDNSWSPEALEEAELYRKSVRKAVEEHLLSGRPVIGSRNGAPILVWPDGRVEDVDDESWERALAAWRIQHAGEEPATPDDEEPYVFGRKGAEW